MKDPFYTYGSPELCSWQVTKDGKNRATFWIQTTSRVLARKLRKRQEGAFGLLKKVYANRAKHRGQQPPTSNVIPWP
jgi:hypothetical protein